METTTLQPPTLPALRLRHLPALAPLILTALVGLALAVAIVVHEHTQTSQQHQREAWDAWRTHVEQIARNTPYDTNLIQTGDHE